MCKLSPNYRRLLLYKPYLGSATYASDSGGDWDDPYYRIRAT